jgi:hypothetical protein
MKLNGNAVVLSQCGSTQDIPRSTENTSLITVNAMQFQEAEYHISFKKTCRRLHKEIMFRVD